MGAQTGYAWTGDWEIVGQFDPNGFMTPKGIAVDKSNNVFVVDATNAVIRKLTASGWSLVGGQKFISHNDYPVAVAIDASGNMYVVNSLSWYNNIIWKYNGSVWTDLTYNRTFKNPSGIAVDSAGNIYVTDSGNGQIVKSNGLTNWSVIGSWDNGGFNIPTGICVDKYDNVYVTDQDNSYYAAVRKLSKGSSTWVTAFNTSFSNVYNPSSISIDNDGNAYVTNSDPNFKYLAVLLNGSSQWAYIGGNFNSTFGVAVDGIGNIFVTDIVDLTNSKIKKHQPWVNQISWTTQPGGAKVDEYLNPQPALQLKDKNGNKITKSNGETVNISLSNSNGAYLFGTTSKALVNGIVQYDNLSIDQAGSYNLVSQIVFKNKNYWNYTSEGALGIPVTLVSTDSNHVTIMGQVETPTASVPSGTTVPKGTVVSISCATQGSKVYFTTDGSTPTTSSLSGNQVTITGASGSLVTLKLMATAPNMENSIVSQFDYTIQLQTVAPTASVPSGSTVPKGTVVSISCATQNSKIYFTTDGSSPTTSSLSGNQVTITGASGSLVTLKLMATAPNMENSIVSQFDYTVQLQTVAPTASVPSGTTVPKGTVVSISCATQGSKVYYTTDGSTPTTSSLSGNQVTITGASGSLVTLKLMATAPNMENSIVSQFDYTIQLQTVAPTASVPSGSTVPKGTVVSISCATQGSKIYYTTDGSTPTTSSLSGNQVTITGASGSLVTLKLMATAPNMENSIVSQFDYTIQLQTVAPTASVPSGTTVPKGTVVSISCATQGSKVYYTTDGSTPTTSSLSGNQVTITGASGSLVTLKLMATAPNMENSIVSQFDYTIQLPLCQEAPVIHAENRNLTVGVTFDPLANVTAIDCDGSNIQLTSANIIYNNVDNTTPGVYKVTYQVTSLINERTSTKTIYVVYVEVATRHQSINDFIESIALEQAALAHILNAEGEKMQKLVIGSATNDELLAGNSSIKSMVDAIAILQMVLHEKLELIKDCSNEACV
ncbi:chitobiase/beta-hexosaminidase C-terminal domain-containing protein [Oscillospiraceae bacterium PP1C4]